MKGVRSGNKTNVKVPHAIHWGLEKTSDLKGNHAKTTCAYCLPAALGDTELYPYSDELPVAHHIDCIG